MIQRVVRAVLRMPAFVLLLAAGVLGIGLYCYKQLNVEAYPNPCPPLVEVLVQPNGWGAEEVERQVTIPLEIGLAPACQASSICDLSRSSVWRISKPTSRGTRTTTPHRQRLINRLGFVFQLPSGLQAVRSRPGTRSASCIATRSISLAATHRHCRRPPKTG